jgi:hypothetical protein
MSPPAASDNFGDEGRRRLALAQRVADAHRGIDDASLMAVVSGSTVDDIADARSDVDMCIALAALPDELVLREACRRAGGEWFWHDGDREDGIVVSFYVEGIEVQIGYCRHAWLADKLDDILLRHNPDTPYHKVAEGLLKAVPLAGAERLAALKQRLADFPPALGRAMVQHGLLGAISWRGISQLLHRDAALTCRDIQVDACYRLLLVLCGLNGRYFTRFQFKRLRQLASKLALAPPRLAERIDGLIDAPAREAFAALHTLEGEVLDLVAQRCPEVDLGEVRRRRPRWSPE